MAKKKAKKAKPKKAKVKRPAKKAKPAKRKAVARKAKAKPAKKAKKPQIKKKSLKKAAKKPMLKKSVPKANVPTANEIEIGIVRHYFTNIMVAVIDITSGELKVGDMIHIKGATSDFKDKVTSMQINHLQVQVAKKGDAIGLKVDEHVREHDRVYVVK